MRILITGSAGYLGSKVVDELAHHELFGIDIRSPNKPQLYKHFAKSSVTDERAMDELFNLARPDIAIHLAFMVNTLHNSKKEEEIDVVGTELFLKNCARHKVGKIIFMSSAAAYGALPENKGLLTEEFPVRGNKSYSYSRLKAKTDLMAQDYMKDHPECAFVILRPCLFIGPNTSNSFFEILKFPVLPQISDPEGIHDIDFQFIHEDDMAACLVAAVEKYVKGIYNVAADGLVKFSEIAHLAGKRRIAIPSWFLYPITWLLWNFRLIASPPGQLDFMRYPWVMDNTKMKLELFKPRFSSREAFQSFITP